MADASPSLGAMHRPRPSRALEREFYVDAVRYAADLEKIWRTDWLFAGHSCEIASTGAFFVFPLAADSISVVRQPDGTLAALHNVCRHRGSLLVDAPRGVCRSFVCPYHQWVYTLDGTLRHTRTGLPACDLGLVPVHVREL